VRKYIPPAMYELSELKGECEGEFNVKSLKPYREVTEGNWRRLITPVNSRTISMVGID
jgi:hypothetical protein